MSDHTPTREDLLHDLEADLAGCDAATPGPWDPRQGFRPAAGADDPCNVYVRAPGGKVVAVVPGPTGQQEVADAYFVARARLGWPAAIRRALHAENEAGRVLRLLDTCRDDWQGAIEERDEALDRVEELEAEVAALRKQVEGHCDRIARQSELLTRKAEGGEA
jgi:hypothetical protein